jgi:hypothetical protein
MAAKKTTTKKTKTKKAKTAKKKAANRRLTIRCSGGCTAHPDPLHVNFGDTVVMKAVGTDAQIKFGAKSPFRRKTFNLMAGKTDSAKVVKKPGTFSYRLACASCPSPSLPPRIIID